MDASAEWDVVVVGGGPAGASAAFWLARYRRRVLLLDDRNPRNEAAWAVHGYPGILDPDPQELRGRIRSQAAEAGALIEEWRVTTIAGEKGRFAIEGNGSDATTARRVILAYGRQDRIPDVPGLRPLYGTSVFHCPDCDGPSLQGGTVGVLGHDRSAAVLALYLLTWADATILLTNGKEPELDEEQRATLDDRGVAIEAGEVVELVARDGLLHKAALPDREVELRAIFFHWGSDPSSRLGPASGCECDAGGDLLVDSSLETSVGGVYAAGDIVGRPHLAISAAAGGVRAALAVHRSLLPQAFLL